ncbi:MAG: DUF1648 domain-containing protein [Acidobacteriota bacterium]
MRLVHVVNIALITLYLAASAVTYVDLPDRFPTHFGIDGQPDAWSDKSPVMWFLLPLIGLASLVVMYGVASAITKSPGLLNIPDKKRFLQLPPERQKPVFDKVKAMLYWLTATITVLFMAIQVSMWQGAHGDSTTTTMTLTMVIALGMTPVLLIVFLPGLTKEVDQQVKAYQAEGGQVT